MQQKKLSDLEQEVMDIVWNLKKCKVRDVLIKLRDRKKIAYTTVATILQRLFDKGLVNKVGEDIALSYSPKISKETYSKSMASYFLKKLISSYGDTAIASFAESVEDLPKAKKDYFLRLLEEYDKRK